MTTGATIHTTNGLWLDIKPRQQQQQPDVAAERPSLAAPVLEQRELALAFTDPTLQQQQQQQVQP